jgi:hypothetical protein
MNYRKYSLLKWMLEEGGAHITTPFTDGTTHVCRGLSIWNGVWQIFSGADMEFTSLVKVMVLLGDAPPDFIAKLSPHNAEIATQGRQIRALRPLYLERQQASISAQCSLPTVLQSIVTAYASPTPEDMWIDWVQWL